MLSKIRKLLAVAGFFFCAVLPLNAQTPTVVTITVTDVNGLTYSNAKVSAQLIPSTATPTIIVNGVPTQIGGQVNSAADANGSTSMNLFCNSAGGGCSVISPAGTQWQITATISPGIPPPAGTGPQACSSTVTITGATQTVALTGCPALSKIGGIGAGVTTSGSPAAGNLTKFSGSNAITNGDLTGDCSTSGGLTVTCGPFTTGILPVVRGGTGTGTPTGVIGGSNISVTGSFPNQTISAIPFAVVQNGLMAEFRMQPSETCGALVDYSGNGNNATGTVGTAPTMIAVTGGCNFTGAGAVSLPAALNSALTIQVFAAFQPSATTLYAATPPRVLANAFVQGNDAAKHAIGMECLSRQDSVLVLITSFSPIPGGCRPVSEANDSASANLTWTTANPVGTFMLSLAMDTVDQWYYNGTAIQNNNAQSHPVAGQQTAGNYQLGGATAGAGQTAQTYYIGQIYYVLFYNRVLTASEVLENYNLVSQTMASRGVNVSSAAVNTDQVSQIVALGDSITQGTAQTPAWCNFLGLPVTPLTNQMGGSVCENQGIQSATAAARAPFAKFDVDTFYRQGAMVNALIYWMGTNDNTTATTAWGLARDYLQQRQAAGFKTFAITMASRVSEDSVKNALNPLIRSTANQYTNQLCDVAANPNLGADGAFANLTYFFTDQIHPVTTSAINIIAPIVNACLAREYGNKDFSVAKTFTAPAGIAFVNSNTFSVSGFSSAAVNIGQVTGGQSFVIFLQGQQADWVPNTSTGDIPFLVANTSNGGTVYYIRVAHSGQLQVRFFRAAGLSTSTARGVWAQYSGVSSYSLYEGPQSNNAGSGPTMTGGAITPNQNNSMVVGVGGSNFNAASVAGSGSYTLRSADAHSWLADFLQGSAAATTPTVTNSNSLTNYGMTSIVLTPEVTGLVQIGDADVYSKVDPSGASVTAMLPTAVGATGARYYVKNVQPSGANTVTVVPKAFRILSVTGNGTTVTYTVDNTYSLTPGQTVTTSGCTTGGFNLTGTVATVPSTTTFTVTNATVATENEPVGASFSNEKIDGATSSVVANGAVAIFQSVLVGSTTGGANWVRVQ